MGMIILSHAGKKYGVPNTTLRLNWDKGAFDEAPKDIVPRGRTQIRRIDEAWIAAWSEKWHNGELPTRIRSGE